jgi:ribosomal protein S18 acetylase RimI-like enzyme
MRQTLDAAQAFGLRRVELTVRESNAVAIELYKRFGFAIEGLQRSRILIDGAHENLVLMGVLL